MEFAIQTVRCSRKHEKEFHRYKNDPHAMKSFLSAQVIESFYDTTIPHITMSEDRRAENLVCAITRGLSMEDAVKKAQEMADNNELGGGEICEDL